MMWNLMFSNMLIFLAYCEAMVILLMHTVINCLLLFKWIHTNHIKHKLVFESRNIRWHFNYSNVWYTMCTFLFCYIDRICKSLNFGLHVPLIAIDIIISSTWLFRKTSTCFKKDIFLNQRPLIISVLSNWRKV